MTQRPPRRRSRQYYLPLGCILPAIALLIIPLIALFWIPMQAARAYGPSGDSLGPLRAFQYSVRLLISGADLTSPLDSTGAERLFVIPPGSPATDVARRLQADGLVRNAETFEAYLVYSGIDTRIQSGEFSISPALTAIQIAQRLQDATPTQVKFAILPGWRIEEVAASLPTSGLQITTDEFLALARAPQERPEYLPASVSVEGFLLPGEYTVPRVYRAEALLPFLLGNFTQALSPEMRAGFEKQGLDVYQAVTLASLVQREAIKAEEQPTIASVFLNRLKFGMRLETDPTVQYALGWDGNTWWRAPLSVNDLSVDSPYNTYQIAGLPPGPIASPALSALQAVAFPADTPYFFFRARCDGSRLHSFAETYEQHLQNACN